MKVKIWPYIDFWSTSYSEQIYIEWRHGKCQWDISSKEYTRLDKIVVGFLDFWQEVLNLTVNKIQARRNRKINIQIDAYDTWSMDHTLSYIIKPMLKQLKITKHGAPFVDPKDVPVELRPTKKEINLYTKNGETDDKFFARWDWVLDEMIFAFENKHNDWEEKFYSGVHDRRTIDREDGSSEWVKGPNDTFEVDWKGLTAHQERITQGFKLFGKYYESLWD